MIKFSCLSVEEYDQFGFLTTIISLIPAEKKATFVTQY